MISEMKYLVLLIIFGVGFVTGDPTKPKIWGGQNATYGQFPFMAAFNNPDHFCNGIIIAPSWILTAGHCVANVTLDIEVYVGSPINHVNGTAYGILEIVLHELYYFTESEIRNDIALVRINGTLEYNDNIQTIEIADFVSNSTCTAIGWGESIGEAYPPLQYLDLLAIDIVYCFTFIPDPPWMVLGADQMCAWTEEGRGLCFYDDGGPLVCDGRLVGVRSFGVLNACASGFPSVYTRALPFVDWIQAHI